VRWQDSPRADVNDDDRRRTLPREFGRTGETPAAVGGRLRHSETLPRTGARPRIHRELAFDMLDSDWPADSLGLDDELRQVHMSGSRPSSRRSSRYRGDDHMNIV